MKIKQINIYGYGKWTDQTFDLDPHFQVIAGPNEAGKSTILSFIQSILFGFPKKSERDLRYEPKQSNAYGGNLVVETEKYGQLQIERVAKKTVTGDVKIYQSDGEPLPIEVLDELLGHLSRADFKAIYGFNLTDLEKVNTLDPEEIQGYFTSIGATGSSRYVEKSEELSRHLDSLYKPRGQKPIINQLLTEMNQLKDKMQALQEHYQDYLDNESKLAHFQEKFVAIQEEQRVVDEEIAQIPQWQEQINSLDKIEELNRQLQSMPTRDDLPEDGLYKAEHWQEVYRTSQLAEAEARTNAQEQSELLELTDAEKYYLEHRSDFDSFEEQKATIEQLFKEIKWYQGQIASLEQRFDDQATEFSFATTIGETVIPEKLSLEEQDNLRDWQNNIDQISKESEVMRNEVKANENLVDELKQQVQELKQIIQNKGAIEKPIPLYQLWFPILITVISFIILSLGFFVATPQSYTFWLVGVLGILAGIFMLVRTQSKKKENLSQKEIRERILKQYQRTENQIGSIQEDTDQLNQQLERKHQSYLQDLNAFNRWKIVKHWPADTPLAETIQLDKKYDLLRQMQYTWREHHQDIRSAENQILEATKGYPFYGEYDDFDDVAELASNVLTDYQSLKSSIAKIQPLLERMASFEEKEASEKKKQQTIKRDYEQWLADLGVNDIEELKNLYQQEHMRQSLMDQIQWLNGELKEQDIPYTSQAELDHYASELKDRKAKITDTLSQISEERTHIEAELLHLAQDGTYGGDRLQFESYKTQMSQKIDEWASLKIAAYLLDQMLKLDLDNRYPIVQAKLNEYFVRLTHQRYRQVTLTENGWQVEHENGQFYQLEELSRGTIEPLYLSFRLAFSYSNQDILNLPLIIDDAFVNFDDKRYEETMALLKELSQDIQIIYLTIDCQLASDFNFPTISLTR